MSRRAILGIGTIVAIVVATSVFAFRLRPNVPPVTGARRLFELPGAAPYHWWLSGSELLLLRNEARPNFFRRALDGETEIPLPGLDSLFRQTSGSPETIRVSPDGSHLLWSPKDRTSTIASTLDGSKYTVVKHTVASIHVWHPDSKRWADIEMRNGHLGLTHKHSLDEPTSHPTTIPLSAAPPVKGMNLARAVVTTQGQFLVQLWAGPDHPIEKSHLLVMAFTANAMFTHQLDFAAPHANYGGEVFFSPEKFLMGWTLRIRTPLQELTGSGSAPPERYNTGFWVTNQRTRKTTALGSVETVRNDPNSGPFNAQISPDGKYLSYVYQNALYLLPITP